MFSAQEEQICCIHQSVGVLWCFNRRKKLMCLVQRGYGLDIFLKYIYGQVGQITLNIFGFQITSIESFVFQITTYF